MQRRAAARAATSTTAGARLEEVDHARSARLEVRVLARRDAGDRENSLIEAVEVDRNGRRRRPRTRALATSLTAGRCTASAAAAWRRGSLFIALRQERR